MLIFTLVLGMYFNKELQTPLAPQLNCAAKYTPSLEFISKLNITENASWILQIRDP